MYESRPPTRVTSLHHIRPGDIDAWGHLNHAKAVELFELGRYDWVSARRGNGSSYGCLPVVTRVDVSYRREVFLAQILVSTQLENVKHYSAEFLQTISLPAEPDKAAIVGRIWLSFLNRETRRPMRVQDLSVLL